MKILGSRCIRNQYLWTVSNCSFIDLNEYGQFVHAAITTFNVSRPANLKIGRQKENEKGYLHHFFPMFP